MMMNAGPDHYAVLEVDHVADAAVIRQAYKRLILQFHPDKNTDVGAADRFQAIVQSYELLSDPNKRALYDYRRGLWSDTNSPLNPTSSFSSAASTQGIWPRHRRIPRQAQAPALIPQTPLKCTLEELFTGFRKRLRITRTLELADGRRTKANAEVTVTGTPGWRAGHTVTYRGAIVDVPEGMDPQDVEIVIQEEPHARFMRHGDDLSTDVRVPLFDALFGHTCFLDLLDGTKLSIPVFSVTQDMSITLPGQGMPRVNPDGTSAGRGDLVLNFGVEGPTPPVGITATQGISWKDAPLNCTQCHQSFRERDNHPRVCLLHPGRLEGENKVDVFSQAGQIHVKRNHQRWACCGERPQASIGCVCYGRHVFAAEECAAVRERCAYNSLMVAVHAGDALAVAHSLLGCREADLGVPLATAISSGHFLPTVLLLRAGANAELHGLGGPRSALRRAAMVDKQLIDHVHTAFDSQPAILHILASVPGTAPLLFMEAARRGDTHLATRLLCHDLFGAARCAVTQQPGAAAMLLALAIKRSDADLLLLLLKGGADVDLKDRRHGATALHQACVKHDLTLMQLILAHGARTTTRDRHKRRPLDLLLQSPVQGPAVLKGMALLGSAMLDEALQSMGALTVVRILLDRSHGVVIPPETLRPTLTVLDAAVRSICDFTESLELNCPPSTDDSCWARALAAYQSWRTVREEALADFRRCNPQARIAMVELVAAGVFCKTWLQEEISYMDESLQQIQCDTVAVQ